MVDPAVFERRMAMADHVQAYKHEQLETGLRPDQIGPFESLLDFLDCRSHDGRRTANDMLTDLREGGYAVLPTGFGKTALMAKLTIAAGIGTTAGLGPEARPLRALVLTPTKTILHQTIGEDKDDGFKRFAPDLRVTPYYGDAKDLSGDVVAITYHSFEIAVNEGKITKDDFDLILADEAHHLMGPKWSDALRRLTGGEVPVLGLTASPQYDKERHLKHVLQREICTLDIRDLIDIGVLSAAQLLAVATTNQIKVKDRRGDYSDEELRELAHDPGRNGQIMDWVRLLVDQGRQVLSFAVRGNDCWHARQLAYETSLRTVYDPLSGSQRPIVARALGSFMKDREISAVLDAWERGEVDVLYVVDKLREGWNSKRVGAVVDGAPTTSQIVATQRLGRGMRPNPDWPVTVFVSFLDKVIGHKPQFTPWHVLGESQVEQNKVIGVTKGTRSGERGELSVNDLPQDMVATLMADYMLIDELTLTSRVEEFQPPPEGWVMLAETTHLWQGRSHSSIVNLLKQEGYQYRLAVGRRGPMGHIPPEAVKFLQEYRPPPLAGEEDLTIPNIAVKLGRTRAYVERLARDLDIPGRDMRVRGDGGIGRHFTHDDLRVMEEYVERMSKIEEGDVAVTDITQELGVETAMVLYFMANNPDPIKPRTRIMAVSGREGFVVTALEAAYIRRHFAETTITGGRMSLDMLAEAAGKPRSGVTKWVAYLDMEGKLQEGLKQGRYRNPATGHHAPMRYLEPEDAETVLQAIRSAPRLPDGVQKLIKEETERRKVLEATRSSGERFSSVVERSARADPNGWQEFEDVQEQLYATDFAARSLMRLVQAQPGETTKSSMGHRLLRNTLVQRMGEYCVAKVGFAPDEWVSMGRLSFVTQKPPERIARFMRDQVISLRDRGLFRSQQPQYKVDEYYSPPVALPTFRELRAPGQ
jgi:superfamily II DNA or RNA helicase